MADAQAEQPGQAGDAGMLAAHPTYGPPPGPGRQQPPPGSHMVGLLGEQPHPTQRRYWFWGKPRLSPPWLGSSQRLVTTLPLVKNCTPSVPCACALPNNELFQPPNE